MTYSPNYDYKFFLLTHDQRTLGITHESSDWLFFRDLGDGITGKLPSDIVDIYLEQGRWRWCATFEETRTSREERDEGMFLVTDTGNVLEVTEKTAKSVKLKSLLSGRDAAISHQRMRRGIVDDGWQFVSAVEAEVAALVNEFEGGWI